MKHRGPTLVVVLTLALAIGAATVVLTVIDAVRNTLPVADRDGLVFVSSTDSRRVQAQAGGPLRARVSLPDLVDWSERSRSFETLSAVEFSSATLTGTDVPLRVSTAQTTVNLLLDWGLRPTLGRGFREEEGRPGGAHVAILTETFWRNQFSGDAGVLGTTVILNGVPHTVVGVLPSRASVGLFRQTDLMLPLVWDPQRAARDDRTLFVTGRLRPGVTQEQAAADLEVIAHQLQVEHPETNAHIGAMVQPLIEASGFNVRFLLAMLGLIATLLVGVACANVANIILAQATAKRHELAVRAALGASRIQGVRQLIVEHVMMAVAGGVLGVVLASAGVDLLRWLAGDTFGFSDLDVSWRVLVASVLVTLFTPVLFGLLPALQLSRVDPNELRDRGQATSQGRRSRFTRNVITGVQVAAAVILMIQVGLIVRTAWRLTTLDTGFDPSRVLTFRIELPETTYARPDAVNQFTHELRRRLGGLPGVAATGLIDRLPIADRESITPIIIEGAPPPRPDLRPVAARASISDAYLRTMRIPVLRGRDLTEADLANASLVALVNEEARRRYWPGGDPIGARLAFDTPEGRGTWLTIVGIVGNVRNSDADQGPLPEVYVPLTAQPERRMAVVVRSEGANPVQLVPAIRAQIAQIDRTQPIFDVASMQQVIVQDLVGTLILAAILGTIAFVSLCLAASGVYGVVAHAVGQRTHEIGIRMALGATPQKVVRMVIAQVTAPVVSGATVGLMIALALAYLISTIVTEVQFRDPVNYIGVSALIVATALISSYIPARRAARVDPLVALRYE